MAHVLSLGRCIAPDLIGMGESDKMPNSGPGSYTFEEHRRYLDELSAWDKINGDGMVLTGAARDFCRTWPAQRGVTVRGAHFLPEDAPEEIGLCHCRLAPGHRVVQAREASDTVK